MREIDRWALLRLNQIIGRMTEAFDRWDLHLFYHDVHGFCAHTLSAVYLDVLKDTLYTDLPDSPARHSAQTALWRLLLVLTKMIAPVLTFTADEIWQHCRELDPSLPVSVQLTDWPDVDPSFEDEALDSRWQQLLEMRANVTAALEQAKDEGRIDQPLGAAVTIGAPEKQRQLLESYGEDLRMLFVVSQVDVQPLAEGSGQLQVEVAPALGEKCERCWLHDEDVGLLEAHPTLCPRCAERVSQWPQN